MRTSVAVSDKDLRTMMRIINASERGDDGPGLAWSTLEALETLVPCQWITFNGIDVEHRLMYFQQGTGAGERATADPAAAELDDLFWLHYRSSDCSYPERSGDYRTVTTTSDFYTLAEHRTTPMYIDVIGPGGADHEMMACLPDGPGRQLRLIVWRGHTDPDFTERDRAVLSLLRPHLHTLHQELLLRRHDAPVLTDRQWELLRLVEAGLSNIHIARRLHIAENTVRKHLENIYQRLDVSSRTAALAKAIPRPQTSTDHPDRATPLLETSGITLRPTDPARSVYKP
jgi:DNA-binding CsgD family transcriptional regulator